VTKQAVTDIVKKIASPLAEGLGLEIVDIEFVTERGQTILRVLIDRDQGVRLEDCEALSRGLGDELDNADPIEQSYSLEISSAGLERPLKKDSDFIRFAGRKVKIKLFSPLEGRKNFAGTLVGIEGEQVLLGDTKAEVVRIPLSQVAKANLVYEQKGV
jgi:ribosome maturation factor RimP